MAYVAARSAQRLCYCHWKDLQVREFIELAFLEVGIEIVWSGYGLEETGKDAKTGKVLVCIDEKYYRPARC